MYTGAHADVFYVDPANGSMTNDGSAAAPWSTLEEVIDAGKIESRQPVDYPYEAGDALEPKNQGAPVGAGDTLYLRSGYHGDIHINSYFNTAPVSVIAQPGHTPQLMRIRLTGAYHWFFSHLTISPVYAQSFERVTLMDIETHGYSGPCRHITAEACTLYSVPDASGWSQDDWNTLSCNGIGISGDSCTARNNVLLNINFGISVAGDSCLIKSNRIENFSGDGLRGTGNDLAFMHNTVMNCYDVNANHDDGFQSWSRGPQGNVGEGTVYRISLIGNTIINYTDPNQPFRGSLQGIGCFDGFFEDWTIANNVIITDHWHGISLYGAIDCRIVNNTVVDCNTGSPGPPWIRIGDHKTRGHSSGCVIRNNLSTSFSIDHEPAVTRDHNIEIDDPDLFFVDYADRDLHLLPGSPAVDSGSADGAPPHDIDGTARPQGSDVDVGAYEYYTTGTSKSDKMHHTASYATPETRVTCFAGNEAVCGPGPLIQDLTDKHIIEVYTLSGRRVYRGHAIRFYTRSLPAAQGVYIVTHHRGGLATPCP